VKASLTSYSDAGGFGGYGYLWWVWRDNRLLPVVELPEGSFAALGWGGHCILVVPAFDTIIVHRVDTGIEGRQLDVYKLGELLRLILKARTQVPAS